MDSLAIVIWSAKENVLLLSTLITGLSKDVAMHPAFQGIELENPGMALYENLANEVLITVKRGTRRMGTTAEDFARFIGGRVAAYCVGEFQGFDIEVGVEFGNDLGHWERRATKH